RAIYASASKVYYLGGTVEVPSGCFAGLRLPSAMRIKQWNFDEELLQKFTVRYSDDFRTWKTLESDEAPTDFVKYVIFENRSGETQTTRFSLTTFAIVPEMAPSIKSVTVPEGENAESQPLSNLTDGDYSTWWAVKKNQSNGDTYVLNLAASTNVYDVRICFGTKNDDFMNTAVVEISDDGSKWTALKVKGTSTTTFSLTASYAIQGGNEMKFVDFNGNGATAKFVRLRVISAKTNKWLRLFEMEVNKQSLSVPQCQDDNGIALSKAVDALPYTSVAPSTKSLVYRFIQPNPTVALTIFSGSEVPEGVSVEVTNDGESWTQIGTLSQSAQRFDLSQYPEAHAVRLTWTGTAPTIYEIVEEFDASTILPTAIGIVYHDDFDRSRLPMYDLQGRRVVQPQQRGIYIQGGRKIVY
ncbi:MAG: discoidin domain-containing protein, partial [Prevotella sp.]|nr:discoidin domain-containing protein [Prevotella sp.]